jgi:chemotaxis protein histidine kinase CheA
LWSASTIKNFNCVPALLWQRKPLQQFNRITLRLFDLPVAATSDQIAHALKLQLYADVHSIVFDRLRVDGITTDIVTSSATAVINGFHDGATPRRMIHMDGIQVIVLDVRLGDDRDDPQARSKAFADAHSLNVAAAAEAAATAKAAAEAAAVELKLAAEAKAKEVAEANAKAKADADAEQEKQRLADIELEQQRRAEALLEQQRIAESLLQEEQRQLAAQQQQPPNTTMDTDSAERANEALARQAAAELHKRRESTPQSVAAKKPSPTSSAASLIARSLAATSQSKTGPERRAGPGTPNES